MTDPTPRPDDELVSAVLDGEATPDERALVEADPASRARLAELAAIRDRVAAPVTVPADARERAMAAALAAFDVPVQAATDPGPVAAAPGSADRGPTDELAGRRARRSGSGGRYLAAAAAIVVVLFGVGVALRALNPPAERSTAASSDAAPPSTSSAAGGTGADSGEANQSTQETAEPTTTILDQQTAPATTTAPVPALEDGPFPADLVAVDLGAVASSRDLRTLLLDVVDGRAAASNDPSAPTVVPGGPALARSEWTTCASYLDAVDVELDQLLAVATATVDGRPVLAFAFSIDRATYPAANGTIRIYAVDPANGCATVSVQTTR